MNQANRSGEGSVYASGIWLARVHYAILDRNRQISIRVCDGERDLIAPPVPATDMHIEFGDGSRRPFVPCSGNPATGTYYISQ